MQPQASELLTLIAQCPQAALLPLPRYATYVVQLEL
jgi:hypothetical protein